VIKSFFAVVLLYVIALASMAGHMFFYPTHTHTTKIQAVSKLVTLPTLAFSTSYLSSRIYHVTKNPAYPEMPSINTLDFVYVK